MTTFFFHVLYPTFFFQPGSSTIRKSGHSSALLNINLTFQFLECYGVNLSDCLCAKLIYLSILYYFYRVAALPMHNQLVLYRQYCTENTCKVYGQADKNYTRGDNALLTRFSASKSSAYLHVKKGTMRNALFIRSHFAQIWATERAL